MSLAKLQIIQRAPLKFNGSQKVNHRRKRLETPVLHHHRKFNNITYTQTLIKETPYTLKKKERFTETQVTKYYRGKPFPINTHLLEVVSYLFLDCLPSNSSLN